jgi:hypothetical protein
LSLNLCLGGGEDKTTGGNLRIKMRINNEVGKELDVEPDYKLNIDS